MLVETVLLYVLGIVIMVIGLALSIGLHEIGHLVPAKRFGVKVGQYMIGFGPTVWSRKYGETQYGDQGDATRRIHLDGRHVPTRAKGRKAPHRIHRLLRHPRAGRPHLSSDQIKPGDEDRVFYKLPVWKRIIIMLGGPTMNLLIAIVLYARRALPVRSSAEQHHDRERLASASCLRRPAPRPRCPTTTSRRPPSRRA